MTRLFTTGAEWGSDTEEALGIDHLSDAGVGTFSYDTTTERSGSYAFKMDSGATNKATLLGWNHTGVVGRNYYQRGYLLIPSATGYPSSNITIMKAYRYQLNGQFGIVLTTTGTLYLDYWPNTGTPTAALSYDTWYRIELRSKIGSGSGDDEAEFRLDGTTVTTITSFEIDTVAHGRFEFGCHESPGANKVFYWDDLAINDDQGSGSQNTWPGEGKIVLLKPISDNSRGTWTGGAAGTTNLWDAIDNVPPAGLATETNTSEIENAQNTASAPGDFNMTSYTSAGLSTGGTARVMYLRCVHGEEITTATKTGSMLIVSNPAQGTADTFTFGNDSASTLANYPTGWATKTGTVLYDQSVTAGTSPVARVTKTTSSTAVCHVCQLIILVDYQASTSTPQSATDSQALTSTDSAAVAAAYTDADTRVLSITDSATFTYPLSASADSVVLTSVDTATFAVPVVASDTRTLAIVDSAAGAAAYTNADTSTLTSVDTASPAAANTLADSSTLSITDTAVAVVEGAAKQADDTQALSPADSVVVAAAYTDADTRVLTSVDTSIIAADTTLADTRTLTILDTAIVSTPVASADAQTLTIADTAAVAAVGTSTDTSTLSIADSTTFTYPLSASADSRLLSIVDTAIVSTPAQADDTRTLSVADTASLALSVADTRTLVATDTASLDAAISATADTRALTGTDTAALSMTASDSRTLSLAETLGIGLILADTRSLTVVETLGIGAAATDTRVLILIDTATMVATAVGHRRRMVVRIG